MILYMLSTFLVKHVIVVDDDIDIFDLEQVEWALASRVQADRDVIIVPRMPTIPLDPSVAGSVTSKMGIDATRSFDMPLERYERSDVPRVIRERVEKEREKYFV